MFQLFLMRVQMACLLWPLRHELDRLDGGGNLISNDLCSYPQMVFATATCISQELFDRVFAIHKQAGQNWPTPLRDADVLRIMTEDFINHFLPDRFTVGIMHFGDKPQQRQVDLWWHQ